MGRAWRGRRAFAWRPLAVTRLAGRGVERIGKAGAEWAGEIAKGVKPPGEAWQARVGKARRDEDRMGEARQVRRRMARRGVHWRAVARTRGNGRGSSRRGLARQVGQGVKWLGIDGQGAARLGWAGKAWGFEAARLLAACGKEGPAGMVRRGAEGRGGARPG